jgi:hypothetical protein
MTRQNSAFDTDKSIAAHKLSIAQDESAVLLEFCVKIVAAGPCVGIGGGFFVGVLR